VNHKGIWRYSLTFSVDCSGLVSQAEALKEENDSLRWQLDAYRNEVELLKQEQGKAHREDDPNKEQQVKLLQQALQGMQQVQALLYQVFHNFWKDSINSSLVNGSPTSK
jgi:hypothetical protein